jgi:hypothetical protein
MQVKTLISIAIAGAFATSLAQADDQKAGSGASADAAAKKNAGAEKMFQALDKNKDGFLTREEVQGTPHAKDFDSLDKNGDGKLTRGEHAAAPEHQAGNAGSSGTGSTTSGATQAPSGGAKKSQPRRPSSPPGYSSPHGEAAASATVYSP